MRWLNEPERWSQDAGVLTICTQHGTDLWRRTHYGFVHDNAHALLHPATGDFTAAVAFTGDYRDLYDQAGLYLQVDERNWLKCGVELTGGRLNVCSVLTRDWSDWTVLALPERPSGPIHLRITRLAETVMVDYSLDGRRFAMIRLGYLPMGEAVEVGPMACSPTGQGFAATFTGFAITPPARHDVQ